MLYNLYFMCCVNLLFIISQCWCDRIFSKFNYLCIGFFVFFLELKVDSFSGYIGRTIVNLSSCSILVYTIHYPILSLLYMKTDLFVHTDFSFLAWAGLLLLWFFISYWVYQIPYISSFLRI